MTQSRKHYRALPKTVTLGSVPGCDCRWEPATAGAIESNQGPIQLWFPVLRPSLYRLTDAKELGANVWAKLPDGTFQSLLPGELANSGLPLAELKRLTDCFFLLDSLKEEGLVADEETIEEHAKELGGNVYLHAPDVLAKLRQVAEPIEKETPEEEIVEEEAEIPEEERPLTRKDLTSYAMEAEKVKSHPWMYVAPKEMNNDQFELYLAALKRSYSEGVKIEGIPFPDRIKPLPQPIEPETQEQSGPELVPDTLFSTKEPASVADMDDRQFENHIEKLAKEANERR